MTFKQGYRNTVGKVYEEVHKKVPDDRTRAALKFRVFCCHLINRVFKTGVRGEIFPYYCAWLKEKGKKSNQKVIDLVGFEEWIKEESSENLLLSVEIMNKIFYKRND